MRVLGWSVSVSDAFALSSMGVGVAVVFVARGVGGLVLGFSGSMWLGAAAWAGVLLLGVVAFLAGFAWLLTEPRTYRHEREPRTYLHESVGRRGRV